MKSIPPTICWEKTQPPNINGVYNINSSACIDTDGNIYIIYCVIGEVNSLINKLVIFKMNTQGEYIWVYHQPLLITDHMFAITVNQKGEVYAVYNTDSGFGILILHHNGKIKWSNETLLSTNDKQIDYTNPNIRVDRDNNIYISCNTLNSHINISVYKINQSGQIVWVRDHISYDQCFDYNSMDIDSKCNMYITYHVHEIDDDVIIHKLDSNGQTQWVHQQHIECLIDDIKFTIAVDSKDNIYLVYHQEHINSPNDMIDVVVLKLNDAAQIIWSIKNSYNSTVYQYICPCLTIDAYDDIYLTYEVDNQNDNHRISILKISSNGQHLWVKQSHIIEISYDNSHPIILIDKIGQIYMIYETNGFISNQSHNDEPYNIKVAKLLPPMKYRPIITSLYQDAIYYSYYTNTDDNDQPNPYGYDIIIKKTDINGNPIWSQRDILFNTEYDSLNSKIILSNGHLYIAYQSARPNKNTDTQYDIVIMKMDNNGTILWVQRSPTYNTYNSNEAPSIDADLQGNLYIAYQTYKNIPKTNTEQFGIVVFKMSSNGELQWTNRNCLVNQSNYSSQIKCDNKNNVLYVAYVSHKIQQHRQMVEYSDIMIMRMNLDGNIDNSWNINPIEYNTELKNTDPVICIDDIGNVILCYVTYGGSIINQQKCGMCDLVICKFNTKGKVIQILQSPQINTIGENKSPSISYSSGFIYLTYQTTKQINNQATKDTFDIVITKINSITFEIIWVYQHPQLNINVNNCFPKISSNNEGDCFITYESTGNMNSKEICHQGSRVVICKLNTHGDIQWIK